MAAPCEVARGILPHSREAKRAASNYNNLSDLEAGHHRPSYRKTSQVVRGSAQCLLWVISGHHGPLRVMSVLPPIADVHRCRRGCPKSVRRRLRPFILYRAQNERGFSAVINRTDQLGPGLHLLLACPNTGQPRMASSTTLRSCFLPTPLLACTARPEFRVMR